MSNYPLASNTWDWQELKAIKSVIKGDTYSMNKNVFKFEKNFKKFIRRKYCLMVSSGSAANLISIASFFYTKKPMLKKGDDINYEGAAGSQEIDENGDVNNTIEVWTIKNGKIESTNQFLSP